jgi:hypothetical protein
MVSCNGRWPGKFCPFKNGRQKQLFPRAAYLFLPSLFFKRLEFAHKFLGLIPNLANALC